MTPFSPLEMSTIYTMVGDESDRIRSYKRAWNVYYGRYPDSLRVKAGQPDDNIKQNSLRTIVDLGASFLFGQDLKFTLEDTNQYSFAEVPVPKDEETLWLSKLWRTNKQQKVLTNLALNGAVCGHAFLKIVFDTPFPRLIVLDPSTVTVAFDPEDYSRVLGYKIQYNSIDVKTSKPVIMRQLITQDAGGGSWTITDQQSDMSTTYVIDGVTGGANWKTVSTETWPFSWPPISDCQNLPAPNQYYGTPDLTPDVIHIATSLNQVLSNRNRVVRLKGHPITWGKGFSANQMDLSPESTIILKSNEAELRHLEMVSDMAPAKQLYDDLLEALYEQTHVPPIALGKINTFGNISGLALQILYAPLVRRTETKRRLYGYLLEEVNSHLIEMQFKKKALSTVVHWPPILPVDPLAFGQTLQIDSTFGVSNDTLLTLRGYDAQLELSKRKQEIDDGTAAPLVNQPSLANGTGLPGDMRSSANQAERPDSTARRQEDRKNAG